LGVEARPTGFCKPVQKGTLILGITISTKISYDVTRIL